MATNSVQKRPSQAGKVVAIDVGIDAVRAVEVEFAGGDGRLVKRGTASLNPIYWENLAAGRDALTQAIKSALSAAGISATQVVTALPRRLVTLKNARLPHAEPEQISGMVMYEAQQYIPFPLEEVVLDHQIVSDETDEMTTVMIVAARRTLVEDYLMAFDRAGIEVTLLSVSALALAEHGGSSTLPLALLDVESGEMDVAVVCAGRPLFTRAASLGRDAGGEADPVRLASEVARSLTAYQNEYRTYPLSKLLIAGALASLSDMETTLSGMLEIPVGRVTSKLMPATDSDALRYATATGLALQGNGTGISRISLIPSARVERKAAARRKTNAMAALAACVGVAAVAIYYVTQLLAAQSKERQSALKWNRSLTAAVTAVNDRKAKHDKLMKTYQTVSAGLGRKVTSVDLVKAVSDGVPKNSGIYLTQLTFDRAGALAIHGNAKTESAATDLVLSLQSSGPFVQVSLNYLRDAQTDISAATVTTAGADKKPKAGQSMSFLINCKIPVPVVDNGKSANPATLARASDNSGREQ